MKLKAHYIAPDRIATSLATPTSSYLLTLAKASSTTLTLSYWPATTNTSVAGTVAVSQEKASLEYGLCCLDVFVQHAPFLPAAKALSACVSADVLGHH